MKNGLDFEPSNIGTQVDAYNVASTAVMLTLRGTGYGVASHATAMHVLSARLHRLDERRLSEQVDEARAERAEARILAAAQEIADHYGMVAYHQSDCRGCSLYLCEPVDAVNGRYTNGHAIARLGR